MKEYFYSVSYVHSGETLNFCGVIKSSCGSHAYRTINKLIEYKVNKYFKYAVFDESNVHVSCLNLV